MDRREVGSPAAGWLRRLGARESEASLLIWGAACLAIIGWADVSIANVAEAYFLKRVGVEYLPIAFLASSLLLVATSYAVGRRVARGRRAQLLTRILLGFAVILLPLCGLVRLGSTGAFVTLLLFSKQVKVLTLVVFWVAIGDWLHGRQAKRLFGPLMAGLTLGTIAGSFASQPIGRALGLDGVLYVTSGVLAVGSLVTLRLRTARPARLEHRLGPGASPDATEAPRLEPQGRSFRELWAESGLFRLLLVTTLCSGVLAPMLYFQFSYVADLATSTPAGSGESGEQRLLALYAQMRGWIYAAILVTQLGVASNLYRRIGVPLSTALSPLIYLLGFLGLSVQLSLSAGVAAVAGVRLQGKAIYDPALRVLFNLFPEAMRPRATALLEGPVDRLGGAAGNLAVIGALSVGSAVWVGYVGIPIALAWLVAAVVLWRRYPSLLLRAIADRGPLDNSPDEALLLDRSTLRGLSTQLRDPDPSRCQAAIELVLEASPELATAALAQALPKAPSATRSLLIAALDQLVEGNVGASLRSGDAARAIASLLDASAPLPDGERADLVRAWSRLEPEGPPGGATPAILARGLADRAPAVRLAARAALQRREGSDAQRAALQRSLGEQLSSEDADARRVARQELRALLLTAPLDDDWNAGLDLLCTHLAAPDDRIGIAEAIGDMAVHRASSTECARREMLALRHDDEVRVRVAVLRFVGHAGLHDRVPWIVDRLAGSAREETTSAREALLALGPDVTEALLVQHTYGRRSTRDAILSILRELDVEKETLERLYEREIESLQHTVLSLHALGAKGFAREDAPVAPIVLQRLEERSTEGQHATLLFLAALHEEDRIVELDRLLRINPGERRQAILLEALEALLSLREKSQILPLLEPGDRAERARSAAESLGVALPDFDEAASALLRDPDELTRTLAVATWPEGIDGAGDLARCAYIEDHPGVLNPVEIVLQLKIVPLFERLSTRQLMDLAGLVHEETHATGSTICREGDEGSCLYVLVEGEVDVRTGETLLATMGPQSFFGEMALFDGVARSATVVATHDVRLLRLERDDMLSLMDELPAIAIGICQALSKRVRDLNVRV